ncbi:MAG: response regulator transcription factor [Tepidiformaceae bacterium]
MSSELFDNLTAREREVLDLLSRGMSNAEIAETMFVSVHTVKTHVRHILEKLELDSRHQAADALRNHSPGLSASPSELNSFHPPGVSVGVRSRRPNGGVSWAKTAARAAIVLAVPASVVAAAWVWRSTSIDGDVATQLNHTSTPAAQVVGGDGRNGEQGPPLEEDQGPYFYSPRTLDRLDLQRALEDASPFARSLIEDGVLTPDEYVAAAVASHACTVEGARTLEGVVVADVIGTPGKLSFGFSAPAGGPLDAAGKVYEACHFEYFRDVQSLWNSADAQARFAPTRKKIGACMREAGAIVSESPDNLDLVEASEAFAGDLTLLQRCELASR